MTERFDPKYKDFENICRFCCKKSENLIPIHQKIDDFKNVWNDNNDPAPNTDSIPEMLLKIGLTVKEDDGLPETLCPDCQDKLFECYYFREQCVSSTAYLQTILDEHHEYVECKIECNDNEFEMLDSSDPDLFANGGRLEMLEIIVQPEESKIKRKRGRPRTRVETPPTVKSNPKRSKKKYEKKDICLICGKVIKHNIKGHQAIHDKSETFSCDICGYSTNVKVYMKDHMRKVHVAQRQYPCPHCHLVFRHAVTLKRHSTIHTGEKNYVCEECGKSYRQRDMLTEHRKRHLPPTIQCSFCDKLFYSKNELKSHTGLHTGIKSFKCDLCSAAFVASSSLAAHRRQHKKDNVLPSCKLCGMSFSDRVVFNMHLMDHKRTNLLMAYNSKE